MFANWFLHSQANYGSQKAEKSAYNLNYFLIPWILFEEVLKQTNKQIREQQNISAGN